MPPKVVKVIQDLPELNNDTCFIDWRKDVKVWRMVNNEVDKIRFHEFIGREIHFIGKESMSGFSIYEGYWISLENVCAFCPAKQ